MTDNKTWLWRKKPSEKTLVVAHKQDPSSNTEDHHQLIHILLAEKAELEKDLKDLNDKLSSALSDCNSNDELAKKHEKTSQEALAGWEKAEAKALTFKGELDQVLGQRVASDERIGQLEAALKECMQQLRFVREEKEQRIHDVLAKAAKDYEEKRLIFEEEQAESGNKIVKLEAEISELSEVLFLKEGHVEELQRQRTQTDEALKELLIKIDGLEKHNASLKYEVQVLDKELHIRNEDKEFNRRTADAAHKQHLDNVKKIAKLESECQRLRVLVRKRLPGPAALAKMRNEVQVLERGTMDTRRRADSYSSPDSPGKKINLLVDKLCLLEDENNALRESLQKMSSELQISRSMYARTSLRLSQAEESSKSQMIGDLTKCKPPTSRDLSGASMSDVESDDKVSCAGSWASALVSDINLMDDFVEMEKLALVSIDKPIESSPVSQTKISSTVGAANVMGSQIVPASGYEPSLNVTISKVIQIIEGINLAPQEHGGILEASPGYVIRAVQWKTSEVGAIVQSFLNVCYDLLHGKADLERFAQEVAFTLEWIINHCVSLQSVSSMKDAVKKHFDLDETRIEIELKPPQLSLPATNGYQGAIPLLQIQSDLKEEIRKLKDDMKEVESAKKEVEKKLAAMVDDQKRENEDLGTQLSSARAELDEARDRLSFLEEKLAKKTRHCEEIEATCLELQIQLERVTTNNVEAAPDVVDREDKQLQTGWEIAAASEKLAKCQETIFNLGKQLKALAPPPGAASITVTTPTEDMMSQRSSLLDKMLAEDDEESPKTKEIICTSEPLKPPPGFQKGSINPAFGSDPMRRSFRESEFGPLAIVPSKKQSSGGLLRKLLWRKKKNHTKKLLALPFAA